MPAFRWINRSRHTIQSLLHHVRNGPATPFRKKIGSSLEAVRTRRHTRQIRGHVCKHLKRLDRKRTREIPLQSRSSIIDRLRVDKSHRMQPSRGRAHLHRARKKAISSLLQLESGLKKARADLLRHRSPCDVSPADLNILVRVSVFPSKQCTEGLFPTTRPIPPSPPLVPPQCKHRQIVGQVWIGRASRSLVGLRRSSRRAHARHHFAAAPGNTQSRSHQHSGLTAPLP